MTNILKMLVFIVPILATADAVAQVSSPVDSGGEAEIFILADQAIQKVEAFSHQKLADAVSPEDLKTSIAAFKSAKASGNFEAMADSKTAIMKLWDAYLAEKLDFYTELAARADEASGIVAGAVSLMQGSGSGAGAAERYALDKRKVDLANVISATADVLPATSPLAADLHEVLLREAERIANPGQTADPVTALGRLRLISSDAHAKIAYLEGMKALGMTAALQATLGAVAIDFSDNGILDTFRSAFEELGSGGTPSRKPGAKRTLLRMPKPVPQTKRLF